MFYYQVIRRSLDNGLIRNNIPDIVREQILHYVDLRQREDVNKIQEAWIKSRTTLGLNKFRMKRGGAKKAYLVMGKRGTGKTVLIKDLIQKIEHDDLVLFSPTAGFNPEYNDIRNIHEEYDEDIIRGLLERQRNTEMKRKLLMVFDDSLYERNHFRTNSPLFDIILNGRHYNITVIIGVQYPLELSPMWRANIDYVFLGRNVNCNQNIRLWEQWAGMFPTPGLLGDVLLECTRNYGFMVIDNTSASPRIQKTIFWYKARYPVT